MTFPMDRQGPAVTVYLEGDLTVRNRVELRDALLGQLEEGAREFHVDLSGVRYLDISGLALFASLAKEIEPRGGEIRLSNPSEAVRELIATSRLESTLVVE